MKARSTLMAAVAVACVLAAPATLQSEQRHVLHSATGSGHLSYWVGQPAWQYWDNYSFAALIRADGTVSGQIQYFDKESLLRLHGEVIALKVEGNAAKIGFRITHGYWPFAGYEDYAYGFFVVVDTGQGSGVVGADMISWVFPASEEGFGGTTLEDLLAMTPDQFVAWEQALGYEPQLFAYVKGNLQVR